MFFYSFEVIVDFFFPVDASFTSYFIIRSHSLIKVNLITYEETSNYGYVLSLLVRIDPKRIVDFFSVILIIIFITQLILNSA
jgi:hypothetical protein